MKSIFLDKNKPTPEDLESGLGETFKMWNRLVDFTIQAYPKATSEWKFSGDNYGWNFRISDKKRVILYLLPRSQYFKAALVFGQKATDKVFDGTIAEDIKNELRAAKKYAEGRGIRIDVRDTSKIEDIQELIKIKIST